MIRKRLTTLLTAATALLTTALLATAPGAAGATDGPETGERNLSSTLLLTVSSGTQVRPTVDGTVLRCQPPAGKHPHAERACAVLNEFHGDVGAVDLRSNEACIQLYDPVTVTATGIWRGERVDYRETFGNSCVLGVTKGAIFKF